MVDLQGDEWECRCDHRRRHLTGASSRVTAVEHHCDHRDRHGNCHQERPGHVVLADGRVGRRAIDSREDATPERHANPHRDHHLDEVADEMEASSYMSETNMCERCCHAGRPPAPSCEGLLHSQLECQPRAAKAPAGQPTTFGTGTRSSDR